MKTAQIIKISESLPLPTFFEKSIIKYWTESRDGKINVELLEKVKIAKQNIL